jgi:hypothetical protein
MLIQPRRKQAVPSPLLTKPTTPPLKRVMPERILPTLLAIQSLPLLLPTDQAGS